MPPPRVLLLVIATLPLLFSCAPRAEAGTLVEELRLIRAALLAGDAPGAVSRAADFENTFREEPEFLIPDLQTSFRRLALLAAWHASDPAAFLHHFQANPDATPREPVFSYMRALSEAQLGDIGRATDSLTTLVQSPSLAEDERAVLEIVRASLSPEDAVPESILKFLDAAQSGSLAAAALYLFCEAALAQNQPVAASLAQRVTDSLEGGAPFFPARARRLALALASDPRQGGDAARAAELCLAALRLDPKATPVNIARAPLSIPSIILSQAAVAESRARQSRSQGSLYATCALALAREGRTVEAVVAFDAALSDPSLELEAAEMLELSRLRCEIDLGFLDSAVASAEGLAARTKSPQVAREARVQVACALAAQERFASAIACIENLLSEEAAPEVERARWVFHRALWHLELRAFNAARQDLDSVQSNDAAPVSLRETARFWQSRSWRIEGQTAEAINAFESLHEELPADHPLQVLLRFELVQLSTLTAPPKALRLAEEFLEDYVGHALTDPVHMTRASLLAQAGRINSAIAGYEEVPPGNAALFASAQLAAAELETRERRLADARQRLGQVHAPSCHPDIPAAHRLEASIALLRLLISAGEDKAAGELVEEALAFYGDDSSLPSLAPLFEVAGPAGFLPTAPELPSPADVSADTFVPLRTLRLATWHAARRSDAQPHRARADLLDIAAVCDAESADAFSAVAIGTALAECGFESGKAWLLHAVDAWPDAAEVARACVALAEMALQEERFEDTVAWSTRAIEADPARPPLLSTALHLRAQARDRLGEPASCLEDTRKLLEVTEADAATQADALLLQARAHAQLGQLPEAQLSLARIVHLYRAQHRSWISACLLAADLHEQCGETEAAHALLEAILRRRELSALDDYRSARERLENRSDSPS